ncbi:hypothetical protein [Polyangium sp. y55x31]|uniref:hypothetical protein n=1 Tax=Polyangium sp. y55x31 TaxID=3042688 RepID=UPI002482359B|nr:hypothetical protein [Polyangium sp. y55x31]MDI1481677.1 hypothetical protein [Polyangium sp. y55x31]
MALKKLSALSSDERKAVINSLVPQLSDAERRELSMSGRLAGTTSVTEVPDWSINFGCTVKEQ